jgi:arylsulfatase A-like enzyme
MKRIFARISLKHFQKRRAKYANMMGPFLWGYLSLLYSLGLCHMLMQSLAHNSFLVAAPNKSLLTFRYLLAEIFAIGVFSLPFAYLVAVLERRLKARPARLAQALVLGTPIFLFFASWSLFLNQGMFLDHLCLRMLLNDSTRLALHAIEQIGSALLINLVGGLLVSSTPYLLYRFMAPQWAQLPQTGAQLSVMTAVGMLLVSCYVATPPVYSPETLNRLSFDNQTQARLRIYLQGRYLRTLGPLTTLWASTATQPPAAGLVPLGDRRQVADLPPLVTAEQWANNQADHGVSPYNVIVVVIESLRPEVPSLEREGTAVMPNLRALLSKSAVFLNHYSQSSYSSYADIVPFSSQSPLRSDAQHFYSQVNPYPRPRIYDLLKEVGYKTAIISSQDERWGGMHRYLASQSLDVFMHAGNVDWLPLYVEVLDREFAAFAKARRSGKLDDSQTIDYAINWIHGAKGSPFFLYTNLQNSHFPYRVPEGSRRPFCPDIRYANVGFNGMTSEMVPEMYGRYLDSLHYVDSQIGRLLTALDHEALLENTLVVVTGDTGQAFLEHGYSNHGGPLYDEVVRTPLVLAVPDTLASCRGTYEFATSHINIAPTLLSLLGLSPYEGFQGSTLLGEHGLRCPGVPHYLVVHSPLICHYAVVYHPYKFMYQPATGQKEFYDLAVDPEERYNIYSSDDLKARRLEGLLRAHIEFQLGYYSGSAELKTAYFPPKLPRFLGDIEGREVGNLVAASER